MDNQTLTYHAQDFQNNPKKGLPILRIIFVILALVILVELIIGLKTLLTPVSTSKQAQQTTSSAGEIMLGSANKIYHVGDLVPVTVRISTGGHPTQGVDLVIKYDPTKLEASASGFIKGDVYDDYPALNINSDKGVLRVSGIVGISKPGFIGNGNFGTINFKAKLSGITDVSLDFSPGLTNDTNMVEVGNSKDILEKVSGVKINIQ